MMPTLTGYCPSCGEAIEIPVQIISMEHQMEKVRETGTWIHLLQATVEAVRVDHECKGTPS